MGLELHSWSLQTATWHHRPPLLPQTLFLSMRLYFYGFRLSVGAFSPQKLFRSGGRVANTTRPFMGPRAIKTSRNKLRRLTEYIIFSTTSQENIFKKTTTEDNWKKMKVVHHLSMRARRRWEMTKMIRTTFQRADPMMFRSESFFFFVFFFNWTTFPFGQFHLLEAQLTST